MQRQRFSYILITIMLGAVIFWRLSLSFIITEPQKIAFSQDSANRISIGMTKSEVEGILGVPAGDYSTGPYDSAPGDWGLALVCDWWVSDTGEIGVWFDHEGKVRKVIFHSVERIHDSFWDRLWGSLRSLVTSS